MGWGRVGILFVLRHGQGFAAVFLLEEPGVLEWNFDGEAFEEAVAEGEDVLLL
jgi:hypothetical protein